MVQENGEYQTICDGFLEGYKDKVYGYDGVGTEHDDSYTVGKVTIENGKVISTTGEFPWDVMDDLGESKNENNAETTIKTDSKTNIKLEAPSGTIPNNTMMDIIEITSGAIFDKIKNNLVEINNFKAFDITLKSNDTNIQPKGKVKISVPIPEDFDASRLVIYRFEEDGTKTEYEAKVTNGYATFETDHFSTYVLGEKAKISNETKDETDKNVGETITEESPNENSITQNETVGNNTKLPQTGEKTNAFAGWLTIAISLGVFWLGSMLLIDREKKRMAKR